MNNTPALRPRSVGEILDTSFQLYRKCWKEMAIATGVLVMPLLLMEAVAPINFLPVLERIGNLFFLFASAAVVAIAAGAYRGDDVDAVDAIGQVGKRFLSVWGAALIQGILVGFGLILLVVPGVILAALTFGMQQAVMIEGKTAGDAFSRSKSLASGHMLPILATSVLAFLIVFTFMLAFGTALGYSGAGPRLSTLMINLVVIPLNPLSAVVGTVLYYDLRIRKEAYDVQIATERLETAKPVPAF
jgi:hypothetical protein